MTPARTVALLLLAIGPLACAGTHEEPPAPPPPPVAPGTFSGPARAPAPVVDLQADLDGGSSLPEAGPTATSDGFGTAPVDAGTDAQPAASAKRKH
jgi:hypothetical protein